MACSTHTQRLLCPSINAPREHLPNGASRFQSRKKRTDTNQGTIDPASSVRRFGGSTFYTISPTQSHRSMWSLLLASFALKHVIDMEVGDIQPTRFPNLALALAFSRGVPLRWLPLITTFVVRVSSAACTWFSTKSRHSLKASHDQGIAPL
jgi:hypothetical protein